jgi:hypothetical protein
MGSEWILGRLAWGGGRCGLDSTGSGQGPVAGCCECGDEPSGSCATELVTPTTHHEGARGERRFSSYIFSTSALDGGEWSVSHAGRALSTGKGPPVPIIQEAGWVPEPIWTQRLEGKPLASAGDRTSIAWSSSP